MWVSHPDFAAIRQVLMHQQFYSTGVNISRYLTAFLFTYSYLITKMEFEKICSVL